MKKKWQINLQRVVRTLRNTFPAWRDQQTPVSVAPIKVRQTRSKWQQRDSAKQKHMGAFPNKKMYCGAYLNNVLCVVVVVFCARCRNCCCSCDTLRERASLKQPVLILSKREIIGFFFPLSNVARLHGDQTSHGANLPHSHPPTPNRHPALHQRWCALETTDAIYSAWWALACVCVCARSVRAGVPDWK